MKSLFEKLNRLDDSLVESKRVVKKKKLTESIEDDRYEIDGEEVSWPKYFEYKMEEDEYFMDDNLFSDFADKAYELVEAEGFTDVFTEPSTQAGRGGDFFWAKKDGVAYRGNYDFESEQELFYDAAVNASSRAEAIENLAKEYAQLILNNLHVDDDYDDDIDEMLTESEENYELSTLVKDSINHLVNDLGKDPMADDFGDGVCADLENNYDIYVPTDMVKYADWCDAVMCEVSRQLNNKEDLTEESNGISSQIPENVDAFLQDLAQMYGMIDYKDIMKHEYTEEEIKKLRNYERRFNAEIEYEGDEEADAIMRDIAEKVAKLVKNNTMTENRNNPYFAPYGYKDAAKVLNGKAPEYYYHLKEIEMDRGDGVKLARYAMRKGLPVMVNKNSDPDYPEFAIKGEYHWNDYFYPYPTAHEEDLVAWDGNMFTEQSLTESMSFSWLDVQNQIALEQQDGKNPFYDNSAAGDYILDLMGKVEKELNVEVVPSVQGGYGDVFIHVKNVRNNSEKIIDPIDFNKFSKDMINLILEADTENEFVNNYKAEILAYIEESDSEYDDIDEMLTESEENLPKDEWQLIKSDKTYDPEGLNINPADEVLCSGTEEECRVEFYKLVNKFRMKEKTENPPQLAKVYIYFIKIEKLTNDTLVVYYPQAQSKDIYRLRKVN